MHEPRVYQALFSLRALRAGGNHFHMKFSALILVLRTVPNIEIKGKWFIRISFRRLVHVTVLFSLARSSSPTRLRQPRPHVHAESAHSKPSVDNLSFRRLVHVHVHVSKRSSLVPRLSYGNEASVVLGTYVRDIEFTLSLTSRGELRAYVKSKMHFCVR